MLSVRVSPRPVELTLVHTGAMYIMHTNVLEWHRAAAQDLSTGDGHSATHSPGQMTTNKATLGSAASKLLKSLVRT